MASDWEHTKENCVPVRAGRSKAALQEVADPAAQAHDAKRKELWAEVVDYEGDDPLEPWQRYIKWMQEYGVGGGKADLQKVLEACTRELQKHERYIDDVRYLRIWIQYADCLPDPTDVFLFIKEKGIGRGFALFYEAYATFYELRGNFQGADAVYMDGVQRGARPLERLKAKHSAFQQRMAQRIQRRIQDEQVMGPPPPEPVRASLALVGGRAAHASAYGSNNQQQQPLPFGGGILGAAPPPPQQPFGASLFAARPAAPFAQRPGGARGPGVGVMEDAEFADGENGLPGLPGFSTMPQVNNLRELKPYGVVRKENLDRPAAWSQASLLPGGGGAGGPFPSAAPGRGLEIFTDEEFAEGDEDNALGVGPPVRSGSGGPADGPARLQPHPLMPQHPSVAPSAAPAEDPLLRSLMPPPALLPRGLQPQPPEAPARPPPAQGRAAADTCTAPAAAAALGPAHAAPGCAAAATATTRAPFSASADAPGGRAPQPDQPPSKAPAALCAGPAPAPAPAATAAAAQAGGEEGAEGQQQQQRGEEEMSYEELRAEAWFRRHGRPSAPPAASPSAHAGSAAALAAAAVPAAAVPGPTTEPAARCVERQDREHAAQVQGENGAASSGGSGAAVSTRRRAPLGAVSGHASAADSAQAGDENAPGHPTAGAPSAAVPKRRPLAESAPPGAPPPGAPPPAAAPPAPCVVEAVPPLHTVPPAQPAPIAVGLPGRGAACKELDSQPTVTISTRGAFDLLNSLFSEDLPHQQAKSQQQQQQQVEEAQPPAPPPRRALAPRACPSAENDRPLPYPPPPSAMQQQQQQQPEPPQPPASAVVPEPTVTLHTRLAFDALNDMFSDSLPHEESRKRRSADAGSAASGAPHKPITSSDVRRLANAGRTGGAAPAPSVAHAGVPSHAALGAAASSCGGGAVHGGSHQPLPGGASALAIHEDTLFLPRSPPRASAAPSGLPPAGSGGIYEDTVFISAAPPLLQQPQQQRPGATAVHLQPHAAAAPAAAAGLGPHSGAGGGAGSSGLFMLHEDTDFIAQPRAPAPMLRALGGGGSGGFLGRR